MQRIEIRNSKTETGKSKFETRKPKLAVRNVALAKAGGYEVVESRASAGSGQALHGNHP